MLTFNLEKPVELVWFGEFISPDREWTHLTRNLTDYELMIVTEGVLYIADDEKETEVHMGEYLIMPPTQNQHGTRPSKCRFYWLHFNCPNGDFPLPEQGRFSSEAIALLTQRLFLAEQTQHRGLHSHYLATELLLELASTATRGRTEADSSNAALCQKIKDFVKRHPFCEVRVSTVAQELGYHEKYLSTVFRQTEGMTLKSYLSLERTKDIKRLLCVPEYSVAQVAAMLEFSDPHHLSRFFKAQTGMTPTEFKNAMRE